MAVLHITGGAAALPSFDAPAWLADWSDNGGVAIVAGDRLVRSRLRCIDRQANARLDFLRGQMLRQHGGDALLGALIVCPNVEG